MHWNPPKSLLQLKQEPNVTGKQVSTVLSREYTLSRVRAQVGSVSIKNTKNILIKNIGDASLGAVCWWLFGYGVAMGDSAGAA